MTKTQTDNEPIEKIREGVKKICQKFPSEYWQKKDRKKEYPKEFVKALTDAGYLAALIPQKYGGTGLSLEAAAAILEEIHLNGANAAACHAQMYTMATILNHGNQKQKNKYLNKIAKGKLTLQAFGVTEPETGSDTLNLKTTAVKKNNHYVINGQKIWTSRAEHSDLMMLLARTTPIQKIKKRTDGLSVFIVELKKFINKGITIKPIRTMINHSTTEIFLDDLKIPAENLIGEQDKGFKYILEGMNAERILIAAECIGDAKWFINKTTKYANERKIFGNPIGKNQGIQFPVAKAYAHTVAAQEVVYKAAKEFDKKNKSGEYPNIAKMLAADAAWEAAEICLQTHGGFGFAEEYDVERKFRETRLYQVAPISTNLILAYIAEHILNMPRSY